MELGKGSLEEVVDAAFWRGRRVFVTGHTGFKGAWLCVWLQELGAEVTGFALPPDSPSVFDDARVGPSMRSIFGDVRQFESLKAALLSARAEVVIHLAAQALVRRSYASPAETYATNVLGTVHLLEAVRQVSGVRVFVNVTSDKCYDNRKWVWGYRECDPLGGSDPYSSSKAAAELVTAAYRESYFHPAEFATHGVGLASARAGNVIGGGDWAEDRLIPDIVRALLARKPVQIRNPHAIRPWQHVLEPLRGYLLLAQRLYTAGAPFASAWNFGPDHEDARPVSWIVERFLCQWGSSEGWAADTAAHPHEAHCLKLDCAKAVAELGWRPRWNLGVALDAVIEWYKARQDGRDMREVTVQQIATYTETARGAAV